MEFTVFMTVEQSNNYRSGSGFPASYFDNKIYAHYVKQAFDNSWIWDGWDMVTSITRKDNIQLTYEQFLSLPTPLDIAELKITHPELFI